MAKYKLQEGGGVKKWLVASCSVKGLIDGMTCIIICRIFKEGFFSLGQRFLFFIIA